MVGVPLGYYSPVRSNSCSLTAVVVDLWWCTGDLFLLGLNLL